MWRAGVFSRFLLRSSVLGGYHVIRKEAGPFCRTSSSVRLWWELEEPKGPKGDFGRVGVQYGVHAQPRDPVPLLQTRPKQMYFGVRRVVEQLHLGKLT